MSTSYFIFNTTFKLPLKNVWHLWLLAGLVLFVALVHSLGGLKYGNMYDPLPGNKI